MGPKLNPLALLLFDSVEGLGFPRASTVLRMVQIFLCQNGREQTIHIDSCHIKKLQFVAIYIIYIYMSIHVLVIYLCFFWLINYTSKNSCLSLYLINNKNIYKL